MARPIAFGYIDSQDRGFFQCRSVNDRSFQEQTESAFIRLNETAAL